MTVFLLLQLLVVPVDLPAGPWTGEPQGGWMGPSGGVPNGIPEDASVASDTIPADAYGDPEVRHLMQRARTARDRELAGIASYEARVWERIQVGLAGSAFRRERTLWDEERAARVRWEAEGERIVLWEGARRASPVAGFRSDQDPETARALARTLSRMTGGPSPAFYQPGDDRILFGSGQWALHPLADTAVHHYRYRGGDTLRVTLPPDQRRITLVEVQVEPRRSDPRLVAGSLWFHEDSAELVRASYRPARPLHLATDGDEDVPRLLRSIQAEIRQVTVDYSLQEMQWWLPHRFALTVEVRAGGFLRVPATIQWQMSEYRVNELPSPDLAVQDAPEGWSRREVRVEARGAGVEEGDSVRVVTLVPPPDSLHLAPGLSAVPADRAVAEGREVFGEAELARFRRELDRILPPTAAFAPRITWGLEDGLLRYNRVEALGVGMAGEAPLGRGFSGRAEFRLGLADRVPGGELRLQRGASDRMVALAAFRRLSHTSDWEDPLNLSSSLSALLTGQDRGEYYRSHGTEFVAHRHGRMGLARLRLFAEAHRDVVRNTDFHLTGLFNGDTLRGNLTAEEGTWYGGSVTVEGHRGRDPAALRLFGDLTGEVAWADEGSYRRLHASGGAVQPVGPLELGVEAGAGGGWGRLPPQREFFLGGPATIRGIHPGALSGESFWFMRGEVARGMPSFRIAAFGDVGWAGPRTDFGSGTRTWSLGLGASVLEGLLRADLARRLGPTSAWRLHLYLDGIL